MSCPARKYPLRKPKNHRLPIPRWKLDLGDGANQVFTAYLGVQQRSDGSQASQARDQAVQSIQAWVENEDDGPAAFETFSVIDGSDVIESAVWVCYWTDATKHQHSLENSSLCSIHSKLAAPGCESIGIWRETFATDLSRLETNYSGLDYLPGLAGLPGTHTVEHTCSAYWGAARDRIPDSAHDLFPPAMDRTPPASTPSGVGQYLKGTNYRNLVHIRSGQFWENCGQEEADAYELKLEPTLYAGLQYLWESPRETGALGLRYLRNEDASASSLSGRPRKETCGAGFFTDLETLETWAKSHRSHLAIYKGALAHYKAFGDRRRFRTWHEVSVLGAGSARFEYLNCTPKTGVISCLQLEVQDGSERDEHLTRP